MFMDSLVYLHATVWLVVVAVTKQHDFIVVWEEAVRYCNPGRSHHSIYQTIFTSWERTMVDPYVLWSEDGDTITVRFSSESIMRWTWPHVSIT